MQFIRLSFLFILLFGIETEGQTNDNKLIDSLTFDMPQTEKARIAIDLAESFKEKDWKRALHYIQYSEEMIEKSGDELLIAAHNSKIGNLYNSKDVYDVALRYYLKAYEYYNTTEDNDAKLKIENLLAIIYASLNNNQQAMLYFNKQLSYYSQKKDTYHVAKTYNNIGKVYLDAQSLDSASVFFKKSLTLCNVLKKVDFKIIVLNNLGICYSKKGDFIQAKKYFDDNTELYNQSDDVKTKSWITNSIATLYLLQKMPDSTLFYAKKALHLLQDSRYSFESENTYLNLYKAYLLKEDYKNATLCFEAYDQIRTHLNTELQTMNVTKLKLEQQYKENEELRILKESKAAFKYYTFGFGIIIILLILSILLIKYRNRLAKVQLENELVESKRNELNANLELKNKELITVSMIEIQRTQIIDQIVSDLKALRLKSVKQDVQQTIDMIIKQLISNNSKNVWQEFELHYGHVYESFYNILNEKHPELTYRDKRLCALLKLNLTTKEIAQITGQSIKSIENARTRLRKKLNLTNTNTDLITYLFGLQ